MKFMFKDAFISYGRRDSLNFVARLHQQLKLAGYEIWFDKVNIPDGDDYALRINHGIESAHNFIYVMAPRCLTSPYCLIELEYARLLGKRIIPINHHSIYQTDSQPLSNEHQQKMIRFYQFYDLPDPNICTTQDILDRSHALLGKIDRLEGKEKLSDEDCQRMAKWAAPYENEWAKHEALDYLKQFELPVFGQPIHVMPGVVERVIAVFERQKEYVEKHTKILAHTLHWREHQKTTQHLLVGPERMAAEQWFLTEFTPPAQPPCQPSTWVCELICESRKNAENGMTDLFVCYEGPDKAICDLVVQSLSRQLKTCWMPNCDIPKDAPNCEYAIDQGIEGADNVLFFISSASVASESCQRELTHALNYHKRIVPLLIAPTPTSEFPKALRKLQYIDLINKTVQTEWTNQIDEILKILKHDQEYYKQHKLWLVRAKKWAIEKRKPIFLLQGNNLELAKAWLHLAEKRQPHPPLPLHHEFITASDNATRQVGTELFISYSRKDNDFVRQLNSRLQEAGKTVWFDQETQESSTSASGSNFQSETFKGIEHADNFLFVMSPPSVKSLYCQAEIEHAAWQGKRIIIVLHRDIDPNLMPTALPVSQRIDFSNRTEFEAAFLELLRALERHQMYVHQHTEILVQALHWQQNQKATQHLLVGEERTAAQDWLTEFLPPNQPPCQPIPLINEFICEARKNAENLMTDIFVCYEVQDKEICQLVVQSLARHVKTCWTHDWNIQKGDERAIEQGIEGADNFCFFISPYSVASTNCQRELAHALKYHKRIVPLLIVPTPISDIPDALRSLQTIDFTENISQANYDSDIDEILKILKPDQEYYKQHKVLLVRALKWINENQKPSFLLRGYNLENAKIWLRLSEKRQQHPPLELHQQLITASEAAKGQLGTEVFISYSRKDSDFARHLNTQLQEAGKTTWFDQESISTGVDFEKEILKGIDSADNFVFVLSPDAVESEYCEREVNYAADQNKRFISVLHRETDPTSMPKTLRKINWIDFKNTAFEKSFPELVQAIELDREHAHQHTVLQQRASDWAENNLSPNFLLNITACTNAESWQETAQNKQPAPTVLQQEFIQHSRAAIDATARAERRRRNTVLGSVTAGLIIAILLSVFAFIQMGKANKQKNDALRNQSFALSALSQIERDKNTTNGILLALEGLPKTFPDHDRPYVVEAKAKLYQAVLEFYQNYSERIVMEGDSPIYHVTFSPDGSLIATAEAKGSVHLWDAVSGQRLHTLLGHTDDVHHVAFSFDGSILATASDDKTARLWEVPSGKPLATLRGHEDIVWSVAFSPSGALLATASEDKTAHLWEVPSGKPLATLRGHEDKVNHAAFSPSGALLATTSLDKTARLWEVPSGKQLAALRGHEFDVNHAAFSPSGVLLATASLDTTTRLWEVPSGKLLATFRGHGNTVTHVAFSPSGTLLATASSDNTARLWEVPSGKLLATLSGHDSDVLQATFSPSGALLATASSDNTARLWEVPSGKPLATLSGHADDVIHAAFSPSGAILTASLDDTARLWEVPSSKPLAALRGHEDTVNHAAFSPSGTLLATASSDNTARLWEVPGGKPLATLRGHEDTVNHVVFSPSGTLLATASDDNTARLWEVPSGKLLAALSGHEENVNHVAFSPSGVFLATVSEDNTARVWKMPSGKPLATLRGHDNPVYHAAFSPSGALLATASLDKMARLWEVPSGKPLATLRGHEDYVLQATFSPSDALLATASWDGTARLWEVPSGKPLATLRGHEESIESVAFSPSGTLLATASFDNTARLWEVPSGKSLATLRGHEESIQSVAFSPSGTLLATASPDGMARLWEVPSGKLLATIHGHKSSVLQSAFSPSGAILATVSEDHTARLWPVFSTPKLIDEANKLVARCLTPQQREQFFLPKEPAWEWIENGKQLAYKGEIQAAIAKFQRAKLKAPCFKFDPVDKARKFAAVAQITLGKTLLKKGKMDEAIAAFNRAIKIDSRFNGLPLVTNRYIEVGEKLAKQGKITAAATEFSQAKKLVPSFRFEPEQKAKQLYVFEFVEQGQQLAYQGQLEEATTKFKEALALDSTLTFVPETQAKQLFALVLVEQGQQLAKKGQLEEATAKFKEALTLDSTLAFDPETKAKALVLFEQGQKLAYFGRLSRATYNFKEALALDSSLAFALETKAKKLVALRLVKQGQQLAKKGQLEEAIAKFKEALALDSSLTFDPEAKAKKLVAPVLVGQGQELAEQGKIDEAIAKFLQAQQMDANVAISANEWNDLCWYGSLYGQAAQVIEYCEKAVALDEHWYYRRSRGLARALTGNTQGAIEDFQFSAERTAWEKGKQQTQGWIEALKKGENPFTEEVLKKLR